MQVYDNPYQWKSNHNQPVFLPLTGYRPHTEEPEWFTGGPTSQSDTIELHGFQTYSDDSESEEEDKAETGKLVKDYLMNRDLHAGILSYCIDTCM